MIVLDNNREPFKLNRCISQFGNIKSTELYKRNDLIDLNSRKARINQPIRVFI